MTYYKKVGLSIILVCLLCGAIFLYERYAPPTAAERQLYSQFTPLMQSITQANSERKQDLLPAIEAGDMEKVSATKVRVDNLRRQLSDFKKGHADAGKNRMTRLLDEYDGSLGAVVLACRMVEVPTPSTKNDIKMMLRFSDMAIERAERIRSSIK